VIDSSDCPTWEIGADSFVSSQPVFHNPFFLVFLRWIAGELHLALKAIAWELVPIGAIAFRSMMLNYWDCYCDCVGHKFEFGTGFDHRCGGEWENGDHLADRCWLPITPLGCPWGFLFDSSP
jgi:hypothetical protein